MAENSYSGDISIPKYYVSEDTGAPVLVSNPLLFKISKMGKVSLSNWLDFSYEILRQNPSRFLPRFKYPKDAVWVLSVFSAINAQLEKFLNLIKVRYDSEIEFSNRFSEEWDHLRRLILRIKNLFSSNKASAKDITESQLEMENSTAELIELLKKYYSKVPAQFEGERSSIESLIFIFDCLLFLSRSHNSNDKQSLKFDLSYLVKEISLIRETINWNIEKDRYLLDNLLAAQNLIRTLSVRDMKHIIKNLKKGNMESIPFPLNEINYFKIIEDKRNEFQGIVKRRECGTREFPSSFMKEQPFFLADDQETLALALHHDYTENSLFVLDVLPFFCTAEKYMQSLQSLLDFIKSVETECIVSGGLQCEFLEKVLSEDSCLCIENPHSASETWREVDIGKINIDIESIRKKICLKRKLIKICKNINALKDYPVEYTFKKMGKRGSW